MLRFLPLKNNSVTIGYNFLLDSISAIIYADTIQNYIFFVGLYFAEFS